MAPKKSTKESSTKAKEVAAIPPAEPDLTLVEESTTPTKKAYKKSAMMRKVGVVISNICSLGVFLTLLYVCALGNPNLS